MHDFGRGGGAAARAAWSASTPSQPDTEAPATPAADRRRISRRVRGRSREFNMIGVSLGEGEASAGLFGRARLLPSLLPGARQEPRPPDWLLAARQEPRPPEIV